MKMPLKIGLGVLIALIAACYFLIDVIPPPSLSLTRMSVLKYRIWQYTLTRGTLPAHLKDLPPRQGYDSSIKDAWGYPFDYSFDVSGVVTLKSPGAPKDMTGTFATRDAEGRWQNSEPEWMRDPLTLWRH